MAKLRVRIEPTVQDAKIDRYRAKDLGNQAKTRLKFIKYCLASLVLSIMLNIYLFVR